MDKYEIAVTIENAKQKIFEAPITKGIISGAFSLIPFYGAAVCTALSESAFQLYQKNAEAFAQELNERVNRINQDKIDRHFLNSDEFVAITSELFVRMSKTHQKEKIILFANFLINSALKENNSIEYKEGFLRIIDDLSPIHLLRVSNIANKCSTHNAEDKENNRDFVELEDIATAFNLEISRARAYCQQAMRYGILNDWGAGRYGSPKDKLEITEYGEELLSFILEHIKEE